MSDLQAQRDELEAVIDGLDLSCASRAVESVTNFFTTGKSVASVILPELFKGEEIPPLDEQECRMVISCVADNVVKGIVSDLETCVNRVKTVLKRDPWMRTNYAQENASTLITPVDKPKRVHGTVDAWLDANHTNHKPNELAQAVSKKFGKSIQAARTAVYNWRKRNDVAVKKDDTPKVSKADLARQLFDQNPSIERKAFMAMASQQLGISELAAQTYYYAAKKATAAAQ